ncbi:MAG: glycosyltransferase [Megasphaera elsdenii]|nr:glycosyltransferase [Megasphaera elsdenii]
MSEECLSDIQNKIKISHTKTVVLIRTTSIYNDSRAMKEINTLSRHGYRVIVLGWDRDGKAITQCKKNFNNDIIFYFFERQLKNIGLRHINRLFSWFSWVYKTLYKIVDRDNIFIIHACDLDAGIPALWFVKKNKSSLIKLVYDIYDYYVDSHSIPSLIKSQVEKIEISVINASNLTIICNEERKWQIRKACPKNILVIHNAPDLREIDLPFVKEQYDYAYCGSLAPVRLLKEIFESYDQHQDIRMIIGGYGVYDTLAKKMDEQYFNFHFRGALSYPDVLRTESSAKILSAIYDPAITNHRLAAPNKFYEALALGKPLIVCQGTGIDNIVEKEHLGIVIPYDVEAFYSALYQLLRNAGIRNEMSNNAKKLFYTQYNWGRMEKILLNAYERL